mmetsp:Transcript_36353/g.116755  ORF Transcript_36353/g.116755 Transcript_36353/m.116755 type:complete len:250 (-) Transcript_36353:852-1601(-)
MRVEGRRQQACRHMLPCAQRSFALFILLLRRLLGPRLPLPLLLVPVGLSSRRRLLGCLLGFLGRLGVVVPCGFRLLLLGRRERRVCGHAVPLGLVRVGRHHHRRLRLGLRLLGGAVRPQLALEHAQPLLNLEPGIEPDGGGARLAQRVDSNRQGALRGQHPRDLALVLGLRLPHKRGVVDEPVLWRVVLGLERAEERLLGAEDLHRRGGLLGQVHQRARMRDEPRAHQLAHHHRQVGRDGLHPVLQVIK